MNYTQMNKSGDVKKIVSFSLWGDLPKYCEGALKNAHLASSIYPGWICRFYVGQSVPEKWLSRLESISTTQVIRMSEKGDWRSMFWRFFPTADKDVLITIVRDVDSRLTKRESAAVREWINSDKQFHIMRDHPYHTTEILGGMWGAKNGILLDMKDLIDQYQPGNFWQVDQRFLSKKIYPRIRNSCMVHDEFFEGNPFPTKRVRDEFVGRSLDENDRPVIEHIIALRAHTGSKSRKMFYRAILFSNRKIRSALKSIGMPIQG